MEYLNMYHEKLIENIIVKTSECKDKIQVTKEIEFEKLKEVYNNNDYYFSYSILDTHYHFTIEA